MCEQRTLRASGSLPEPTKEFVGARLDRHVDEHGTVVAPVTKAFDDNLVIDLRSMQDRAAKRPLHRRLLGRSG
jgi:hypothetical protein